MRIVFLSLFSSFSTTKNMKCPQDLKNCVQIVNPFRAIQTERNDMNRQRFASPADNLIKGLQWLKSSTFKDCRDLIILPFLLPIQKQMGTFLLDIKPWEIVQPIFILHFKMSSNEQLGCITNENLICSFCRNQNQKMVKIVKSRH